MIGTRGQIKQISEIGLKGRIKILADIFQVAKVDGVCEVYVNTGLTLCERQAA